MDERSSKLVARGIGLSLGILYALLFVSAIWKYVATKDISNSTWEIIFIVAIPALIAWFARRDESLTIPRMISGELIPTGTDEKKRKERKDYYWKESIAFAIVVLVLTVISTFFIEKDWQHLYLFKGLGPTTNIVTALAIEFVISIVVFFAISYVWEEQNIKRYNKKLDELEDIHE